MSWDADLYYVAYDGDIAIVGNSVIDADFNYTHNTGAMLSLAMKKVFGFHSVDYISFWNTLDHMSGEFSKVFLRELIIELIAHASDYDKLNPPNGWGSRATLCTVLAKMHEVTLLTKEETIWICSG